MNPPSAVVSFINISHFVWFISALHRHMTYYLLSVMLLAELGWLEAIRGFHNQCSKGDGRRGLHN